MKCSYEIMTNLQYKLKALTSELNSFQSGEKYVKIHKEHQVEITHLMRQNRESSKEIEQLHRSLISLREQWFQVFEDLQKESETGRKTD